MASTTKVCDQYYWLLLELPTSSGSVLLGSGSESGERAKTGVGVTFSEAPGLGANPGGVRQPMSLTSRYIEGLVLLIKYEFHTLIHDKIQWKHCNPEILKN